MSSVIFALSGMGTRVGATGWAVCAQTLPVQTAQASIAPSRNRAVRFAVDLELGIGSRGATAAVLAERFILVAFHKFNDPYFHVNWPPTRTPMTGPEL